MWCVTQFLLTAVLLIPLFVCVDKKRKETEQRVADETFIEKPTQCYCYSLYETRCYTTSDLLQRAEMSHINEASLTSYNEIGSVRLIKFNVPIEFIWFIETYMCNKLTLNWVIYVQNHETVCIRHADTIVFICSLAYPNS